MSHCDAALRPTLNISERCIAMIELFPGEEEERLSATQTRLIMSLKPEQNQPTSNLPTSRREFLGGAALTVIGLSLPVSLASDFIETKATLSLGFHDLHRGPDSVMAQTATGDLRLNRTVGRWMNGQVVVTVTDLPGALRVQLSAPTVPIKRLHLRWRARMNDGRLILGDAWERGYGAPEWRVWIPDRVMAMYLAAYAGALPPSHDPRTE